MDWAKAKSILIVAFIITNIILGYNLYINQFKDEKKSFFEDSYMNRVTEVLKTKNIKILCKVPKYTPQLSRLSVKYEVVDEKTKKFFEKPENIKIVADKKLLYTDDITLNSYNIENAKKEGESFLVKHNLDENVYVKEVSFNKEYIEVNYGEKYKNYFLEQSYMKLKFYKNGKMKFERLWLIPTDENDQKKRVMTSVEAITNIYDKLQQNDNIVEIQLGYYNEIDEKRDLINTKISTAFPMWRIKTSSNKYYYTQAFDF